ncbi:hypothetical protein [Halopiger thermotolerans]
MSDSTAACEQRSTSIGDASSSAENGDDRPRLERAAPTIVTGVRKTCFWGAILLPFLHVPLLLSGLATAFDTAVFLGLLSLNLVALYVGHAYEEHDGHDRHDEPSR